MKNNNSELLNKIIEPSINYISLKNDIDIDFDDDFDIKDRHYRNFYFDYDDDIDDLDIVCFENDDDETVCFDDDDIDLDDINDHNVIFLTDDN